MFRPRIIPVLTLKGKGLVKTTRFDKKRARYIGDPINAVHIFNDLEADELIFLDITASLEQRCISTELVRSIGGEAYMPFAVGGGIKDIKQIHELISAGAEKVIINTTCINNPELIYKASRQFGNQSIIAAIDVKKNLFGKYKIYINDGSKEIDIDLDKHISMLEESGAGELFINAIDRDGTMSGYDLELVKFISEKVKIPVIACGGAGKLSDLSIVISQAKASAASAGSMFVYHGSRNAVLINYPDKNELLNTLGTRS
jgi:imidazole glycerol-phosphate synthase subunit HisF